MPQEAFYLEFNPVMQITGMLVWCVPFYYVLTFSITQWSM